jgi:hypothetical protein
MARRYLAGSRRSETATNRHEGAGGRRTVALSPPAARGVSVTVPSCTWARLLTMARPRPTPWFGELTARKPKRGVHRTIREPNKDVRAWLDHWNENPRPYLWTKTADQILATLDAYCNTTNASAPTNSDHAAMTAPPISGSPVSGKKPGSAAGVRRGVRGWAARRFYLRAAPGAGPALGGPVPGMPSACSMRVKMPGCPPTERPAVRLC